MELFDKKFVYFMWDDSLQDKEGFFAIDIATLKATVNEGSVNVPAEICCVYSTCSNGNLARPFHSERGADNWLFFYHDPNYECKLAYAQGKTIQIRHVPKNGWVDLNEEPKWHSCYEYRVKPDEHVCGNCKYKDLSSSCTPCNECMEDDVDSGERSMWEPRVHKKRRMTNRELAKWLAQGNGECVCDDISMTCWRYIYSEADTPVRDGVKIRGWNAAEWHEPTVEEE